MKPARQRNHITNTALAFIVAAGALVSAPSASAALVAQYHFDESSGTTAFDSAGSFNGTLSVSGSAFVPGGISGNAISLTKSAGGLVNMGTSFPGFSSGDFSIVVWVKTSTPLTDSIVLSKHEAFSTNGYMMVIGTNFDGGAPNKATFWQSSLPSQGTVSTTTVNDGAWHQVVGVFRAGLSESIYVDGSPAEATNGVAAIASNAAPFLLGGQNQNGTATAYYNGLIDEVQVYNEALTNTQINALFQNPAQAVPEPSTALFGAVGFASILLRRFRKSSKG